MQCPNILMILKSHSPFVLRLMPQKSNGWWQWRCLSVRRQRESEWVYLCLCKKEKFARHLKKICKTFVKYLRYTHLINIWNVMCVGGKYFKIQSANLKVTRDLWHLTSDIWHLTFGIWHLVFDSEITWHDTLKLYWHRLTSFSLMDSEVILAIWKRLLGQSVSQWTILV